MSKYFDSMNAKDLETLAWIDTLDPTGEIEAAALQVQERIAKREALAEFVAGLPKIDAIKEPV